MLSRHGNIGHCTDVCSHFLIRDPAGPSHPPNRHKECLLEELSGVRFVPALQLNSVLCSNNFLRMCYSLLGKPFPLPPIRLFSFSWRSSTLVLVD